MTEQDKLELKELWTEISKQDRSTQSSTLKYFADSHNELKISVAEIKVSLNDFKESTCSHLERLNGQTAKNTSAWESYKIWRGWITGGLAIISIIVLPLIVYIFTDKLAVAAATQLKTETKVENVIKGVNEYMGNKQ
jgi:hypothetical protein